MKNLFLAFIFILVHSFCVGQGLNNLWLMGYGCCQTNFNPMNIDFSSGSFSLTTVQRDMNIESTNGVICDSNGQLLFYSNGIYIANAQDDTMQNGSGLNPGPFTTSHTTYGLTIPQANLILPIPGDSTKYYLFHTTSDDPGGTYAAYYLYYSIIDMSLDNGLGAVVQKNEVLINDTIVDGRLTACRHANGRDWWMVCHDYLTGILYTFLITPHGIQGPYSNDLHTIRNVDFGQCVFSSQGDRLAYYENEGDLDIADFDRCTGTFSNIIHINIDDSTSSGGACFSPSGRYLYIPSSIYLYQFDMQDTSIASSKITIGVWDSTYSPHPPFAATFYLAALAPDGKIYINCGNGTQTLHVINYPDSAGSACDFCQHCIQLPAYNGFTMPNHPNYFLSAEQGSVCDSLTIDVPTITTLTAFNLFPNPVREHFYLTQNNQQQIKSIAVFNSLGQEQSVLYRSIKGEYIEINSSSLSPGIYIVEMQTEKQRVVKRFVKE